jgi:NAD(P)-dependent dehydrogenase (short-subunit alcohol dehydrogenase family)
VSATASAPSIPGTGMPPSLAGKTLFISGSSRGIGLAIALRAARDGANLVVTGKTETPHPKLPGTIHSAAADDDTNDHGASADNHAEFIPYVQIDGIVFHRSRAAIPSESPLPWA